MTDSAISTIKVLIHSSPGFGNFELLQAKVNLYLKELANENAIQLTVIEKNAACQMASRYAVNNKMGLTVYSRKNMGVSQFISHIASDVDMALLFWDGKSGAGRNLIRLCAEYGVKYRVFNYI